MAKQYSQENYLVLNEGKPSTDFFGLSKNKAHELRIYANTEVKYRGITIEVDQLQENQHSPVRN